MAILSANGWITVAVFNEGQVVAEQLNLDSTVTY